MNNAAVFVLLREAFAKLGPVENELRVVDIACGKGGALGKFVRIASEAGLRLEYIGADADESSVAHARERSAKMSDEARFEWVVHDCFNARAVGAIRTAGRFNGAKFVSCMFALHYAARDEQTMGQFLDNVAQLCAPGAVFVFTTTNAPLTLEFMRDISDADGVDPDVDIHTEQESETEFGFRIHFRLGSEDQKRLDFSEWLVHRPKVTSMLENRGFKLLSWCPLTDHLKKSATPPRVPEATLDRDWAICSLYDAAMFLKM